MAENIYVFHCLIDCLFSHLKVMENQGFSMGLFTYKKRSPQAPAVLRLISGKTMFETAVTATRLFFISSSTFLPTRSGA